MKASACAHSIYRSRTMTIKTMKRINLKIHQNTLKESTSITIIFSKLFTLHTPQNVHIIGQSAPTVCTGCMRALCCTRVLHMWVAATMYWCVRADLLEDEIGNRGVGVNDNGGHFVVPDLLQQRCRVQVVIQHPDWQRLPGDEKATDQFLQSQQAWGRAKAEPGRISMSYQWTQLIFPERKLLQRPGKILIYPQTATYLMFNPYGFTVSVFSTCFQL